MAFKGENFALQSPRNDPDSINVWRYFTDDDTVAQVSASDYFQYFASFNSGLREHLAIGDWIEASCSDGAITLKVTALSPNLTTEDVNKGTISTSDLEDDSVTADKIATAVAGDGLAGGGGTALSVNVDDSTIETDSDTLRIKDAGVDENKLAGSVAGTGIDGGAGSALAIADSVPRTVTVALTSAEFKGMYAAPKEIVSAGGANTLHIAHNVIYEFDWGSAQYTGGGNVAVQYDSTINGAGVDATADVSAATFNGYTADSVVGADGELPSTASSNCVNKGLYLSNESGAFATGDSDVYVHLTYSTVSTTV